MAGSLWIGRFGIDVTGRAGGGGRGDDATLASVG